MTKEVLDRDQQGHEIVVIYRESPEESEERRRNWEEQEERGRDVARSFRRGASDAAQTHDDAQRGGLFHRGASDSAKTDDEVT